MDKLYFPEGTLIHTSENEQYTGSIEGLEYAMKNGIILEAKAVLCDSSHNLHVEFGSFKGIIPRQEAVFCPQNEPVKDIAIITRVGKSVCFVVSDIEYVDGEERIILSRKDAQKMCCENYISRLRRGDVIDACITHIEPFGVFCDIGCGVIGLLPIDCISVSRIGHPSERFGCGQKIRCVVKDVERERCRVTLSHKELLGTWEENAERFCAGETVRGVVRSVEPYGIFVELTPNLAGLAEWCEGVQAGCSAAVYIKSIIPEKMKIKLVIVDTSLNDDHPQPVRYFSDESHIDLWRYSPEGCPKEIFSSFQ